MIINLGVIQQETYQLINTLIRQGEKQNQTSEETKQNLEYLKNFQENLNRKFSQLNFINLPSRRDIINLTKVIEENRPKQFELQHKDLLGQVKTLLISTQEQLDIKLKTLQETLMELKYK